MKGKRKLLAAFMVLIFLIAALIPSAVWADPPVGTTNFIHVFIDNDDALTAVRVEYDSTWLPTTKSGSKWRAEDQKEFVTDGIGRVELTYSDGTVLIVPRSGLVVGMEGGGTVKVELDALAVPSPGISITKAGSPDPIVAGNPISYTITITNTGDTNLSNVVIVDALLGLSEGPMTLDMGDSYTVSPAPTYDTTISDIPEVENTAVVTANFFTLAVTDSATDTVTVEAPPTYTVTYAPGDHGDFTAQVTSGLYFSDDTPDPPATPGDPGWTFSHWSPTPTSTVEGDAIYVAQWTQDSYTVTYDPGDHGDFTAQVTPGLNYGDDTPDAPATPGDPGWTFSHWNPTPSETVTGTITYVAQWTQDSYTVTYDPGDHGDFTAQVTPGLNYGDDTPDAPATPGDPGMDIQPLESDP